MTADPTTQRRWTVADYMAMDDDDRYEVLRGELRMVPAPTGAHQRVITVLGAHLLVFVEEHDLGYCFDAPFDIVLADDTVVQPDFTFVRKERFNELYDGHGLTGAPDLIVEVLSPSTARLDRTTRRDLFAETGVAWLVFVDPVEQTAEVFRLNDEHEYVVDATFGGDETLTIAALPGFSLSLDTLWMPQG